MGLVVGRLLQERELMGLTHLWIDSTRFKSGQQLNCLGPNIISKKFKPEQKATSQDPLNYI